MKERKDIFIKVAISVIAACALLTCVLVGTQIFVQQYAENKIETYETELNSTKAQMAEYKKTTDKQLEEYKKALEENDSTIKELEAELEKCTKSLEDKIEAQENALIPSTTNEYKAWLLAQTAIEPNDLYDDMSLAYEQFAELYSNGYEGTVLYDATLKLLVPAKKQNQLDSYIKTLERYFGSSNYYTARSRFIDDLVEVNLLIDEGDEYYSWYSDRLTAKNVASTLDLTIDAADALLGLLRMIGWDV